MVVKGPNLVSTAWLTPSAVRLTSAERQPACQGEIGRGNLLTGCRALHPLTESHDASRHNRQRHRCLHPQWFMTLYWALETDCLMPDTSSTRALQSEVMH